MPHPLSRSITNLIEDLDATATSAQSLKAGRLARGKQYQSTSLVAHVCTKAARKTLLKTPQRPASPRTTRLEPEQPPILPVFEHPQVRKVQVAPALPLELLSSIVSQHLQHDLLSLKSLSRTCRYLHFHTQPLLFRRLHLYMHPTAHQKRGSDVVDIIAKGSSLLPFVKHVVILSLFREDSEGGREDSDSLRVLMNLPCLTKVSVRGYFNRSWDCVPTAVQLAIKTSLRGKHLSAVEVTDMASFPVYLLEGCRSLKELSLSGASRRARGDETQAAAVSLAPSNIGDVEALRAMRFSVRDHSRTPEPIYLETLKLTMPSVDLAYITDWLVSDQSTLSIKRAKKLDIRHRSGYSFVDHSVSVARLLDECRTTVQDVWMELITPNNRKTGGTTPLPDPGVTIPECLHSSEESVPTVDDVYKLFDISKLASVRRLYVTFSLANMWDKRQHLDLLRHMFRSLTSASPLKELGLFFWHGGDPFRQVHSEQELFHWLLASGSWNRFDRALSVGSGMDEAGTSLKRVTIQLSDVPSLVLGAQLMGVCLPRLSSMGILDVQDKIRITA